MIKINQIVKMVVVKTTKTMERTIIKPKKKFKKYETVNYDDNIVIIHSNKIRPQVILFFYRIFILTDFHTTKL